MYFVTTIEDLYNDNDFSLGNIRTVGFWSKFEDAENVVINNNCDINETIYDYAIIEELEEGLYPFSINSFLYKFDYDIERYVKVLLSKNILSHGTYAQVG
jgi:hypothetical protein